MNKKKIALSLTGIILIVLISIGISYSFYTAKITELGLTESQIKTKRMGLIYTGVKEINNTSIIPGSSFNKTFTVENTSDVKVKYNIYMEDITNEFNEDLIYTLNNQYGVIKNGVPLPATKNGKTYLETEIEIEPHDIQNFNLQITFQNTSENQKEYLNANFNTYVGIDVETDIVEEGKYTVRIDPNGGIYNETSAVSKYTLSTGETLELQTPTKENYTFQGWENEEDYDIENNTLTVGEENIVLVAKWNLSEDVVAYIGENYYTSIQNAINAANPNDEINLLKNVTESPNNNKTVKLNLRNHTLTGTLTNTGTIQIINGIMSNNENEVINNTGTLIMGENDENAPDLEYVAIKGNEIGINQNGVFNFYDGYVEADVAINGGHNDKPEGYYVYVDHIEATNKQKAYLITEPSLAVAKLTINNNEIYYFNLQDAMNTAALNNVVVEIIRNNFEASYALNVASNQTVQIDLNGNNLETGYTITNNGNLIIKDSAEEKGSLKPSVTIANNGSLTIQDMIITETTDANVINSTGSLTITNSILTALGGYAVSITDETGQSTINMDNNTYLKANTNALYTNTTNTCTISGGNIEGLKNEGKLNITGGIYTKKGDGQAINNIGDLTVKGAIINSTNIGINNSYSSKLILNSGVNITATSTGVNVNSEGDVTINNGATITSTNGYGISNNIFKWYDTSLVVNEGAIINGFTAGIFNKNNITINGGTITGKIGIDTNSNGTNKVQGGTIIGTTTYGIKSIGNLIIGNNDEGYEDISTTSPEIRGETHGLYINSGTVSFYDGILEGRTTKAYEGTITEMPEGATEVLKDQIIEGVEYKTAYLVANEYFVKVNNVQYNSLAKAIRAISTTGEIEFFKSVEENLSVEIPEEKNITIDLKGNTYSITQGIVNNGTLTIKDTTQTVDGDGNIVAGKITTNKTPTSTNISKTIDNKKTLIIDSGIIENTHTGQYKYTIYNDQTNSNLTINGGKIISTGTAIYSTKILTITGGEIESTSSGISNSGNNENSISNCKITTVSSSINNFGKLTLNSGTTINATGNANTSYAINNSNNLVVNAGVNITSDKASGIENSGIITINGGTIIGSRGIYNTSNNVNNKILGGLIIGTVNYGIFNNINGTLTIGNNDEGYEDIDITSPEIRGKINGLKISNGTINFYDGILKGQNLAHDGTITETPEATTIESGIDTIDGIEYKTEYLVANKYFVKVNETPYNSLAKAIRAIDTTGEIEFYRSSEENINIEIPSGKNITIDLKGNTYSVTQTIANKGTLTIKDSTQTIDDEGNIVAGKIINTAEKSIENYENSSVTINSGIIENSNTSENGTNVIYSNKNGSQVTINGGKLISRSTRGMAIYSEKVLNITGGEIESESGGINNNSSNEVSISNFKITSKGTGILNSKVLTLNSGVIINSKAIGIDNSKTLTINSGVTVNAGTNGITNTGTLIINEGANIASTGVLGIQNSGTMTINGGTISGKVGIQNRSSNDNKILGGTIIGTSTYGVYNGIFVSDKLTIGDKSIGHEEIDLESPKIVGETHGIYINQGTVNFYDGIIAGKQESVEGDFKEVAPESKPNIRYETLEEGETDNYYIMTLGAQGYYVQNGSNEYKSLSEAINAASVGDTLEITDNATVYSTINLNKNITIDLKGKTLNLVEPFNNTATAEIKSTGNTGIIQTISKINLINNNSNLTLNNVELSNDLSDNYAVLNNNGATITINDSDINANYGIENKTNANLYLYRTDVITNSVAFNSIKNNGYMYVEYGNINKIHNESTSNSEIKYATIEEDIPSREVIVTKSTGKLTLTNVDITGRINATGPVDYNGGTFDGGITANNTLTLDEITWGYSQISNGATINTINSNKTLELENSAINFEWTNTGNGNVTIFNNSGNLLLNNNSTISIIDLGIKSGNYFLTNNTNGNAVLTNSNITISGGNKVYGINSTADNAITKINGGSITANNAVTAYGAYITKGTFEMGTKDGNVIPESPLITAVGTTSGIGVKKVNGYFKYYDGKIIASHEAKPDTTTEVEVGYEAITPEPTDPITGYKYCVLRVLE